MKKKLISALLAATMLCSLAACGSKTATESASASAGTSASADTTANKVIKVGASPTPHAEILAQAKAILAKQGYDLQVVEFTDYVQPNVALTDGDIDANYFQHKPYLDDYNKQNGTDLVSMAAIHYEPLGLYPGKTKAIADLKDGAQIAVPNDTTNEARALLLLQTNGLITLKADAGFTATVNDIEKNPKNLKIVEVEAAQIPRSLQDVDMAVINGNYALSAGLEVSSAIAKEEKDSDAAKTYANIIAVRKGDETREDLKALVAALQSAEVTKYITDTYKGAVVPMA